MRAGLTPWPHQLTLARMVARGLRLHRSALIQVPGGHDYRLSYVLPALMDAAPVIIVAARSVQQALVHQVIPLIQSVLPLTKSVRQADRWPEGFAGVLLVEPTVWLRDRDHFPLGIPAIIDQAEQLEQWVQTAWTQTLTAVDWQQLAIAIPHQARLIHHTHLSLSVSLQRRALPEPLLLADELATLAELWQRLGDQSLPPPWPHFRQQASDWVLWAHCRDGQVHLHSSPVVIHEPLAQQVWAPQPVVLIGTGIDWQREATTTRDRLGLPSLTTLQFLPDRRDQGLACYLPALAPPNSPYFQPQLLHHLKQLICDAEGTVAIVLSDQPLQTQVATSLAAEFGSRVRLNSPSTSRNSIGIWDWEPWLAGHGGSPNWLIIPTLPFPSVESPLVAARVAHLKAERRDWFRDYLLPTAASRLIQAIAPLQQGNLAILDSRLQQRQYGQQLWSVLTTHGVYCRQ